MTDASDFSPSPVLAPPEHARGESVVFKSMGVDIHALFVPAERATERQPVLIVSHGAGEFKENYQELADHLSSRGFASLLVDMHGHGHSGGHAYHVSMTEWIADLRAAVDYLETRADVDASRIAAFGLSSGGTAILEAALVDPRIKALVTLDATVMNTLPLSLTLTMGGLCGIGYLKRWLTGHDLKISIVKMLSEVSVAADPEINARLSVDPGKIKAFANFPLPGAASSFFVSTIKRVPQIRVPTLVIWGEEDQLDPVSTAHALHDALTCPKSLEIVPGNGHVGHLDRNRVKVFDLTADWLQKHLA